MRAGARGSGRGVILTTVLTTLGGGVKASRDSEKSGFTVHSHWVSTDSRP